MKKIYVSLPEHVYTSLREEAERNNRPATAIAREAIEAWLRDRRVRQGLRRHRSRLVKAALDGRATQKW